MQGNIFPIHIHLGTPGANVTAVIGIAVPCQLIAVTAVGSNATNATFDCGEPTDPDGIFDGKAFGVSDATASYTPADFNGADATASQPYPFEAGDELEWSVDYDGSAGTALQGGSLTFWFAS